MSQGGRGGGGLAEVEKFIRASFLASDRASLRCASYRVVVGFRRARRSSYAGNERSERRRCSLMAYGDVDVHDRDISLTSSQMRRAGDAG